MACTERKWTRDNGSIERNLRRIAGLNLKAEASTIQRQITRNPLDALHMGSRKYTETYTASGEARDGT
jgi:hypothetical protein